MIDKLRFNGMMPYALGAVAFVYYFALSAKTWTWMFASMDSGDWLSSVMLNMTPHAYGSPLYILLGEVLAFLNIDLVLGMTIFLSVLPAAVTVGLVYVIVQKAVPSLEVYRNGTLKRRLTSDISLYALAASLVVLGAAAFLTQATVLESYSLSVMLLTLSIYFYQRGNTKLWLLMLGLGLAVHIIMGVITVAWLAIEYKKWREWAGSIWIFFAAGVAPYFFTLWSMSWDTPKLFGGELSFEGVMSYLAGTDRIGTMAVFSAPERIFQFAVVLLSSFGLALIPLVKGIVNRKTLKIGLVSFTVVVISAFLYMTNLDYTTWTYLLFGIPFIALLIGYGLSKMTTYQVYTVIAGAVALIAVNSYWMNADRLTQESPLAAAYQDALWALPDGSAVIVPSGSTTGSGLYYVMAQGKDLVPIIFNTEEPNVNYVAYTKQLCAKYQLEGGTTLELAHSAALSGRLVYIASPVLPFWEKAFTFEGETPVFRVTVINMNPDWTEDDLKANR